MPYVVEATRLAAAAHPDVPVIVSLTGPVSTAASIVDPITFYKELRKNSAQAEKGLDYVVELLAAYAERAVQAGASVIAIGDPSATGEILGPKMFEAYALKYNNKFAERVHQLGVPFILHICGDMPVHHDDGQRQYVRAGVGRRREGLSSIRRRSAPGRDGQVRCAFFVCQRQDGVRSRGKEVMPKASRRWSASCWRVAS